MHFFLLIVAMGHFCRDSQARYLSAVILSPSHLCSHGLHCPPVTQDRLSLFLSFAFRSHLHIFPPVPIRMPPSAVVFYSRLHSCVIGMKYPMNSRTKHILLTGSAFPRGTRSAGEGAGSGFSPTHTPMITPLTEQSPTHEGRITFRIIT